MDFEQLEDVHCQLVWLENCRQLKQQQAQSEHVAPVVHLDGQVLAQPGVPLAVEVPEARIRVSYQHLQVPQRGAPVEARLGELEHAR